MTVDRGRKTECECVIDADLRELFAYSWRLDRYGYVYRKTAGKRIYLHHVVFGNPIHGFVTDHIDRDKLNCLRDNFRFLTRKESAQNKGPQKRNKCGLRGVSTSDCGRPRAIVILNNRRFDLGRFDSVEQAADAAAKKRNEIMPFSN